MARERGDYFPLQMTKALKNELLNSFFLAMSIHRAEVAVHWVGAAVEQSTHHASDTDTH